MSDKIFMIRLKHSEDGITVYTNGDGCKLEAADVGVIVTKPHARSVLIPFGNLLKIIFEIPEEIYVASQEPAKKKPRAPVID